MTSTYLPVAVDGIPDELKALKQWFVWKNKIPLSVHGGSGSSTNPATWGTFDQAMKCYESGRYHGIGFAFAKDGGIVGIDLDNCFDEDGTLYLDAQRVVKDLSSYTEYSVSGKGLHIIIKGHMGGTGKKPGSLEVYSSGRYFTVTGHVYGTPSGVEDRQAVLDNIVNRIEAARKPKPQPQQGGTGRRGRYLSNDTTIEKAMNAKNGEKFRRLWEGNWKGNYPSQSEAELALLAILYFWLKDVNRIDILFRQSGLYRPKWDRPDYRERCFKVVAQS